MQRNVCRKGFTLIEIMIVVLIISVLLAIAIPNLMRARIASQEKACIKNLDNILGGKEQYVMEHNLGDGAVVAMNNLVPDYIKTTPACPAGGTYTIQPANTMPSCSIGGHKL